MSLVEDQATAPGIARKCRWLKMSLVEDQATASHIRHP
jgi:hypothetical protein